MSAISRLLERGMQTVERGLGEATCEYDGQTFTCIPSTLSRGDTLEFGGFQAEIQLTIHIRKSLLTASITVDSTLITVDADDVLVSDSGGQAPHPGKVLTKTRRYRVARVREDGAGVYWAVDLIDPSK